MDGVTFFDVAKIFLLWLSPVSALGGVFLMVIKREQLEKLENFLDKEMGLKVKLIPPIETNIYSFQKWVEGKKFVFGLFFLVFGVVLFVVGSS